MSITWFSPIARFRALEGFRLMTGEGFILPQLQTPKLEPIETATPALLNPTQSESDLFHCRTNTVVAVGEIRACVVVKHGMKKGESAFTYCCLRTQHKQAYAAWHLMD